MNDDKLPNNSVNASLMLPEVADSKVIENNLDVPLDDVPLGQQVT